MHHTQRKDFNILHTERIACRYFVKLQLRNTWILVLGETIRHTLYQMVQAIPLRINTYIAKARERAQIIDSAYMVIVLVREQNTIQFPERAVQHLLPEIRTAIYQYARTAVTLDENGSPQPLVTHIGRAANFAGTAQLRNACTCSCPQEMQPHQKKLTSGCISMPNLSRTSRRTASLKAAISPPVAPPRLTRTRACLS